MQQPSQSCCCLAYHCSLVNNKHLRDFKVKLYFSIAADETVFDCDADPNELLESPKSDVIESVTENLSLPPLCSKKDCMEMSPIEKM